MMELRVLLPGSCLGCKLLTQNDAHIVRMQQLPRSRYTEQEAPMCLIVSFMVPCPPQPLNLAVAQQHALLGSEQGCQWEGIGYLRESLYTAGIFHSGFWEELP